MGKLKLTGYSFAAAMLLLTACDDGMDFQSGTGTISPLVDYDLSVVTARSSRAAAEIGDITLDDLSLTITSEDGSVSETFAVGEFPTDRAFNVGKYTLAAAYGDAKAEGFENPAVYGETDFTVSEGKNTSVALTATPSKAMVSLIFDETLTGYMTSCSAQLRSSAGSSSVDYAVTETRPVYLVPGSVSVSVTFEKPNGTSGTIKVSTFTAEAKHHYTMTLSLGGDGSGTAESITVKYDDLLEEEEVTVDISDDVLIVDAPVVTPYDFDNGQTFTIIEGDPITAKPRFDIDARGGIKSAVLTTTGKSLIAAGWPAEIDLANATAAQQQTLINFGYKDLGLFRNPGNMASADFSDVISNIPTETEATEFSLVVTDNNGKQSDAVSFKVKVDELSVKLQSTDALYSGGSNADVIVSYNGNSDPQSVVTMQYLSVRGVMTDATVTSVSKTADQTYLFALSFNGDEPQLPITLRATCRSTVSNDLVIGYAPTTAVSENDVFAHTAWVSISSNDYLDVTNKTLELYLSTDGTNFTKTTATQSGTEVYVSGLTAGTTYTTYLAVDGTKTFTTTFTTESATQLGNSDMESWTSAEKSKGVNNWSYYEPGSPWATLNEVGLSTIAATAMRSGESSTTQSSSGRSGACALVRTVGYGTIYTVTPESKYVLAGELYLGSYDSGANYGIDFASRPAKLSFWYQYSPYASDDTGYADIEVLDASGNTIATGSTTLASASDFTQATISLTYARGVAKASTIRVKFRSSSKSSLSTSTDLPTLRSTSGATSTYTGSELYIDDIELTY